MIRTTHYCFSAGSTLDLFRSVFTAVGRGRRPSLPKIDAKVVANLTWLQLFQLKLELKASWTAVMKWTRLLFPRLPKLNPRRIMERVACGFQKTPHKDVFITLTTDIDDIGPFCTELGICRSTVSDGIFMPPVRDDMCHGAVIELVNVYGSAHQILHTLFPDKSVEDLKALCHKIVIQAKRLGKKNKTKLGEYLVEKVGVKKEIEGEKAVMGKKGAEGEKEVDGEKGVEGEIEVESKKGLEAKKEVLAENKFKKVQAENKLLFKQNQVLRKELQKLKKETEMLNFKLEYSEDVVVEKDDVLEKLEVLYGTLKDECDAKSKGLTDLEETMSMVKNETVLLCMKLKEANDAVRKFKSGAISKKHRRRINYLSEKQTQMQNEIEDTVSCRNQVKLLTLRLEQNNKKLSYLATKVKIYRADKYVVLRKLQNLKNELKETAAVLLDLQSEMIDTRKEGRGAPFRENIQKCVMELVGELDVPTTKVSKIMKCVSKWLHNKDIDQSDLPSTATANNFADIAQVLGKYQLAEQIIQSDRWDLHGDGTSRDSKKILGQQVTLDNGQSLSAGFSPVAGENSSTLLDNVISMMDELSYIYDEENCVDVCKTMISKMFATMSDRSSVNKKFNEELRKHKQDIAKPDSTGSNNNDLTYLYCNAHFLLGLSHKCESTLKEFEKKLETELGRPLGRNNSAKFKNWHGSESNAARYVRTASDVLGPRGDQKNGCQAHWNAYLSKDNHKSYVTSFRSNRFNNLFQGSRGLFHHQSDIVEFLSDYKSDLNLKLQSVLLDASSIEIQSIIRALGIVFCKITGPWWEMLNGGVEYVDQYKYIQTMLSKFRDWSTDASELFQPGCGIFPEFSPRYTEATTTLFNSPNSCSDTSMTKQALQAMILGFIQVTEKQLADFLPGGEFGSEPSVLKRAQMKHCKITNLLSEHEFGDLDFSQFRRRHASLYYHSGIQILKQNHTISGWLTTKSENEQGRLLKMARTKRVEMRKRHLDKERDVIRKTREKLETNFSIKKAKDAKKIENRKKLVATLQEHNGPCQTFGQLNAALANCKSNSLKKELMKNEIRYLTNVLNVKDRRLVMGNKGWQELKENWCLATNECNEDLVNVTSNTVPDFDLSQEFTQTKKRKLSLTESDNFQKRKKCKTAANFTFNTPDTWVAVAYEEEFFIGTVLEVASSEVATIQFLNRGFQTVYRWPRIDDVADVQSKFVFAADIEVVLNANGRTYSVSEIDYLQQLYEEYASEYF